MSFTMKKKEKKLWGISPRSMLFTTYTSLTLLEDSVYDDFEGQYHG